MTKAVILRSKPKIGAVREWTVALGVLTAGNMTRVEAEMKLAAYVPLLQDEFPPGAFCQASLSAVARQCQWFPSYAEIARHLSAWWREHRPAPPALPPPPAPEPRGPPTPEEIAYVAARVAEVVTALRAQSLEARGRDLTPAPTPVGPRHLTPEQLDRLNPLPNGRRRTDAAATTAATPDAAAADHPAPDHPAAIDGTN